MIRTHIVAIQTAALSLALVAAAPTSAFAFPHFPGVHRHPAVAQVQDARLTVHLYNPSMSFRDVKIDGHVYTVQSHEGLSIKAPAGTTVIAETTAHLHRKGDVLFALDSSMQNRTISLD